MEVGNGMSIRLDNESIEPTTKKEDVNVVVINRLKRKIDANDIGNVKKSRLDDLLTKMKSISIALENGSSPKVNGTPSYIEDGEMLNYQIAGLNWLIALHDNGLSGILADEMGLGKTLQTISFIGYLQFVRQLNGKFLIVVPLSTITNWENEFRRWCPSLRIVSLYGSDHVRQQLINEVANVEPFDWDVCLTTYETCKGKYSRKFVSTFRWNYVIMDEGTRIKNENVGVAQVVRHLKARHRLILTGTPFNNNLHELWALLSFLMPDNFQSSIEFDELFDDTACLTNKKSVPTNLYTLLKPILLRRLKSEVLDIEPHQDFNVFVHMTSLQRECYRKILMKNVRGPGPKRSAKLNSMLARLRKCTNHPYLFGGIEPGPPFVDGEHIVNNSGKMIVLDMLLRRLKQQQSRVLIFSQFTQLLDIIEDYLNLRPEYGQYCRLDGGMSIDERAKCEAEFQDLQSNKFIFLLSSGSAALGINLTAADSVIIYDSDWNPQMDLQAISRCHRMGQTKKVRVFRLYAKDTVDERMMDLANLKLRLNDIVIEPHAIGTSSVASKNFVINAVRFGTDALLTDDSVEWDNLVRESSQQLIDRIFENF